MTFRHLVLAILILCASGLQGWGMSLERCQVPETLPLLEAVEKEIQCTKLLKEDPAEYLEKVLENGDTAKFSLFLQQTDILKRNPILRQKFDNGFGETLLIRKNMKWFTDSLTPSQKFSINADFGKSLASQPGLLPLSAGLSLSPAAGALPSDAVIIQGISQFVTKRAKQEVTTFALESARENLNENERTTKALKAAFPRTFRLFQAAPASSYALLIPVLKAEILRDVKGLPANIADNPGSFRFLIKGIPIEEDSLRLALFRDLLLMYAAILNGAPQSEALRSAKYSAALTAFGQLAYYHRDPKTLEVLKEDRLRIAVKLLDSLAKENKAYGKIDESLVKRMAEQVRKIHDRDTSLSVLQEINNIHSLVKVVLENANRPEEFARWQDAAERLRSILPVMTASNPLEYAAWLVTDTLNFNGSAQRFVLFLGNLGAADSSDGIAAALEAFASPVGSWREKRNAGFSVGLQSYVGLAGAYTFDSSGFASIQPFAPVGIELSWGRVGLMLGIVDLGAPVQLQSEEGATFGWKDIFSPGGYFNVGLGNSPFVLHGGAQLQQVSTREAAWRILGALSVDIPLVPLYGWAPK